MAGAADDVSGLGRQAPNLKSDHMTQVPQYQLCSVVL
jgi:hypothetical protein